MISRADSMQQALSRDTRHAVIGGVCAGIARRFGWSRNGTRVVYVIVSIASAAFPGILVYLLLWLLLARE